MGLPVPVIDDYAELFRSEYPRLVRALELTGASRWQAEDVAQEAFARTLAHWRRVRNGSNPPGYLYRTAFRLMRKRGLVPSSPLDDTAVPGVDVGVALRVDVERALIRLPARRRACVIMTCLLDLSTADVAEALSIAPGTVRKQLELARADLRQQLTR